MFTIDPAPRSRIRRATSRQVTKLPIRFTSRILRKRPAVVSIAGVSLAMPAELTSPVNGPNSASLRPIARATASSSATSTRSKRTRSSDWPSVSRAWSRFCWARSTTTARHPSATSARTMASPIPEAPPVTSTASCADIASPVACSELAAPPVVTTPRGGPRRPGLVCRAAGNRERQAPRGRSSW